MRDILDQIKKALDVDLYYLAFLVVLTLPDMCGALESEDGQGTKERYIKWFDDYVAQKYNYNGLFNGEHCYYFRCSLLHQGHTFSTKNYKRIIFIEPGVTTNKIHNSLINDAIVIDLKTFCTDIINGVENWLQKNENNEIFKNNYNKFIKRYPNGLSPYIGGVPIIG